jgi:hypothetical protein
MLEKFGYIMVAILTHGCDIGGHRQAGGRLTRGFGVLRSSIKVGIKGGLGSLRQ